MTPTEYANKLRIQLDTLKRDNRPLQIAAYSALARMSERIFREGRDAGEGSIGQYDTTDPMYVNPKTIGVGATSQRSKQTGFKTEGLLPPTGKHGDTVFKSGKKAGQPHKTTYVNNYKDLRNRVGRPIDRMNLVFTGDLKSDVENPYIGSNQEGPTRININEFQVQLKRSDSAEKVNGLEKRFGKIFFHGPKEIKLFYDTVESELTLLFQP